MEGGKGEGGEVEGRGKEVRGKEVRWRGGGVDIVSKNIIG